MKRKNLIISVVMLTIPLFSSCGGNTPSVLSSSSTSTSTASVSISSSSSISSSEESSTLSSSSSETLSSSESPKGYYKADVSSYSIGNNPTLDVLEERGMPSKGDVNVFVIPVSFSGVDDPQPTNENLEAINTSYFGASSETGWESLSSYYYKSSYGKLNIGGTICSNYKDPRTAEEFENYAMSLEECALAVEEIINVVVQREKDAGFDFSSYDLDCDGYLDAVDVAYFTSRPLYNNKGEEIWWAFTYCALTNLPDKDSPVAKRYFWSPFSMIESGYYDPNIDTHTLVHETGHMMGLYDYYSYDGTSAPCGCADMMDLNVGDQNAYSKMVLGWANPYVVDGTFSNFSITLNSFTETGDCLILRNTETDPWNGMPYDEYLLLQYYTPTGLNEKDSQGYPEWNSDDFGHGGTYEQAGLQVFHVDSRLYSGIVPFETGLAESYFYTDTIIKENTENDDGKTYSTPSKIAANNTATQSFDPESGKKCSSNRQISIVPATGKSSFIQTPAFNKMGLMTNLFGVGDQYGSDTFTQANYKDTFPAENEGKFNDGTTIGYSFKVTRNDESSCDISIYKD